MKREKKETLRAVRRAVPGAGDGGLNVGLAVAAEPATSSSMAYYIQIASTLEDHEAYRATLRFGGGAGDGDRGTIQGVQLPSLKSNRTSGERYTVRGDYREAGIAGKCSGTT